MLKRDREHLILLLIIAYLVVKLYEFEQAPFGPLFDTIKPGKQCLQSKQAIRCSS